MSVESKVRNIASYPLNIGARTIGLEAARWAGSNQDVDGRRDIRGVLAGLFLVQQLVFPATTEAMMEEEGDPTDVSGRKIAEAAARFAVDIGTNALIYATSQDNPAAMVGFRLGANLLTHLISDSMRTVTTAARDRETRANETILQTSKVRQHEENIRQLKALKPGEIRMGKSTEGKSVLSQDNLLAQQQLLSFGENPRIARDFNKAMEALSLIPGINPKIQLEMFEVYIWSKYGFEDAILMLGIDQKDLSKSRDRILDAEGFLEEQWKRFEKAMKSRKAKDS